MRTFLALAALGALLSPSAVRAQPTSSLRGSTQVRHISARLAAQPPRATPWKVNRSPVRSRVSPASPGISGAYAQQLVRKALGISGRGYRIRLDPYGNGVSRARVQRISDGRWKDGFLVTAKQTRTRGAKRAVFFPGPFGPR